MLDLLNDLLWSKVLIVALVGLGLYFSIRSRFVQFRYFGNMFSIFAEAFQRKPGQLSSFQALMLSVAGRVGAGNIAGVAVAIMLGGPGAVFWMWMVAFLGASSAFVESTLGQVYKEKLDGQYRGGPAFYIERGLGMKWYALIFAVVTIFACGVLLPGVQANSIAIGVQNALGIHPNTPAGVLAVMLGLIIFGGVKRIARFAEFVVPFMALAYMLVAFVIMVLNAEQVPEMVSLIFSSAFGMEAGFGAMLGLAVEWGVKRGIYSNEAGQGTGPHAAAAAEVSHPAKQGYVQAFAIYFDTMLVCTSTAFLLLSTGMYNTFKVVKEGGTQTLVAIFEGVPGVQPSEGAQFTQAAVESVLPGWGAGFVALALFFFAFTTIMAYYYMAETNLTYVAGVRKPHRLAILLLRLGIIGMVVFGAYHNAAMAWTLGDIGVGLMAWLNIVAILILQKPALLALRDYERQKKLGLDPTFDPQALGIRNADFWTRRG